MSRRTKRAAAVTASRITTGERASAGTALAHDSDQLQSGAHYSPKKLNRCQRHLRVAFDGPNCPACAAELEFIALMDKK